MSSKTVMYRFNPPGFSTTKPQRNGTAQWILKVGTTQLAAKYFAQNPALELEIEVAIAGSLAEIHAVGSTVEKERELRQMEAFAAEAVDRGLEIHELVIRLLADSPEQAQAWHLEHHRRIAVSLGMDWEKYKAMNLIG